MHFGGIVFIIYRAKRTRGKTKRVLLQRAVVQCLWRVDLMSGKTDIAAAFFPCGRCVTSTGFVPPPSQLGLLMCRLCRLQNRIRVCVHIQSCADKYGIASLENINGGHIYWDRLQCRGCSDNSYLIGVCSIMRVADGSRCMPILLSHISFLTQAKDVTM